jgi:diguanylate cyclase (GGDEF)-like protein
MSTLVVHQLFMADERLQILPVVRDGVPLGLVNRYRFIERMAKPYAMDLFGRDPISKWMDPTPLIVDQSMSLDNLSQVIVDSAGDYSVESFIITDRERYVGIGTVHSLIREMRARKQAYLDHLAHYDHLTGLPNRQLFNDRLRQSLVQAQRLHAVVAVLFVDLDRFKSVNDTLGHHVGDQLLKAVAERIVGCLRKSDTVARLGGDEFTIILPGLERGQDAAVIAQKILDACAAPYALGGPDVHISCSIGISLYPSHGADIMALIKSADRAMYLAKESRNSYQFYASEMENPAKGPMVTYHHLLQAIKDQQFQLHYQPKVDLRTGAITGLEALLRWLHPEAGWIPPSEFIPLAEETGLIIPIGEWVLRTACAQVKAWHAAGWTHLTVAVNISAVQFKPGSLIELVRRVIEETAVVPGQLEFEITESTLMRQTPATRLMLEQLKALGIRISVDDFGTGYSSLSYLKQFQVDTLKIDRAFVRDIESSPDGRTIAKAIITLAHSLKLNVVAEGVETEEQLRFLQEHGCDGMQGFLLSRPLSAQELDGLLAPDQSRGPTSRSSGRCPAMKVTLTRPSEK